jgi:predicted XRE-type DNA-binding protein
MQIELTLAEANVRQNSVCVLAQISRNRLNHLTTCTKMVDARMVKFLEMFK